MTAPVNDSGPALLADLRRAGVRLRLQGEDSLAVSSRGPVPAELRARISALKPHLLEWLRSTSPGPGRAAPEFVVGRGDPHEPFPLSDLQTSFLVGSREGFDLHVRPHQYMEFDRPGLDPGRFEAALNRVFRRQAANLVVVRDDLRLETVRDPAAIVVPVDDLRDLPPEEVERRLLATRGGMERRELPLDRWPWIDVRISRLPAGAARLHYNNNNFFSDAMGTTRLLGTALDLCEHPERTLDPLDITYRDCVRHLARQEESPAGQAARAYWEKRLPDWPAAPAVPTLAPAGPGARSHLTRREMTFAPATWAALKAAAGRHGVTPTNVLTAAYAEVLSVWSGSRHFLLNNMVTHRDGAHAQIPDVMGNFASLYPLEVDWREDEPFAARARRMQSQLLSDLDHLQWSGVKVLQALNSVQRTPGRTVCPFAVGSALFVGQADPPAYSVLETPQVLLDCEFWEQRDGSLWVAWDVVESAFPAGLIDAMERAYRRLTGMLADDANWAARGFDLLPAEQHRVREELNRWPALAGDRLHDALPERAAGNPDAVALAWGVESLTYAGLHARVEHLAAVLRSHGVGEGAADSTPDHVAVVLPKGPEQSIAVLAALRAGGAYVPIDPAWPAARLQYLVGDTGARVVLTDRAGSVSIPGLPGVAVIDVGNLPPTDGGTTDHPRRDPREPAYVIYTSGSTGLPKGAVLSHRGPAATIADINRRFAIGPDDTVFGISSLCFDLSVHDVFGSVAAGARLVLPTAQEDSPTSWVDLIRRQGVTVWNSVPALMRLTVDAAAGRGLDLPSLRVVLLSGDWIPVDLPDQIRTVAPQARVISLGGATEASIWSIFHPIDEVDPDWISIPYGRPLTHQTWHVLDQQMRPAPTWVPGELYIGGEGLALGYLNDPARTAAAFVTHPETGERLYRTGDLGRYRPDGDLEFLGRADFQVKINGFRVEPGEVEHALADHPAVREVAVVARRSGSGSQLAAFVVTDGTESAEGLTAFLRERLPGHLVPSYLTLMEALPLTANAKLDRKALETLNVAGPDESDLGGTAVNETQRVLLAVWEEILGVTGIGIHDDFFDIGGQSFAALRMVSALEARLGRTVPVGIVLSGRTVAHLAEWLDDPAGTWSPIVELTAGGVGPPWVLVHPAGGDTMCYRDLAGRLTAGALAVQAPSPRAGQTLPGDLDGLADLYEKELLAVRPDGPYRLLGWSSGAVIAFELARRLEQRGVVEALLVLDCPAPVRPDEPAAADRLRWFLEDLDVGIDRATIAGLDLTGFAGLDDDERAGAAARLVRTLGNRPDLDPAAAADSWQVFSTIVRACHAYRPPGPVRAPITVVRAADGVVGEFAELGVPDQDGWGWRALTTGAISEHVLPGTHHTLLRTRAGDLAGLLERAVPTAPAEGRTA